MHVNWACLERIFSSLVYAIDDRHCGLLTTHNSLLIFTFYFLVELISFVHVCMCRTLCEWMRIAFLFDSCFICYCYGFHLLVADEPKRGKKYTFIVCIVCNTNIQQSAIEKARANRAFLRIHTTIAPMRAYSCWTLVGDRCQNSLMMYKLVKQMPNMCSQWNGFDTLIKISCNYERASDAHSVNSTHFVLIVAANNWYDCSQWYSHYISTYTFNFHKIFYF